MQVPIVTFERRMNLAKVAAARERVVSPPAWQLLFAKAFSMVAAKRPEFRRAYVPLPWPHLWQADASIAAIAIEYDHHGKPAVGFIPAPDQRPLSELAAILDEWKSKPVSHMSAFRHSIRNCATAWSGKMKVRTFGTFGVAVTDKRESTPLIGPQAATIDADMIQGDGSVDVRMHFDHRVLDGMPVARAMADLEETLCTDIVAELNAMSRG